MFSFNLFRSVLVLPGCILVANAVIPALFLIGGIGTAGIAGSAAITGTGQALKLANRERYVKIVNTMGRDVVVTVNCASGDDRIGEYKLKDGEGFAWKFKPHFLGRTLFWCNIKTNSGKSKHWNVFKGHSGSQNWYLRGDGGYTGQDNGSNIKKRWSF